MECKECGLHALSCPGCIPGNSYGNDKPKIMIVNSYATDLDEENEIATMDSDLTKWVKDNELQVFYTNAVRCRSPKDYKIKVSEVKRCKPHLDNDIATVKPKYVLLLGSQAVQSVLGEKITEIQGTVVERDGVYYVASYSPRAMFYDIKKAEMITKSLNLFLSVIKGDITKDKVTTNITLIKSIKQLKRIFKKYKKHYIAFDIETTGLNRYKDNINLIGFGDDKNQYILDVGTDYSPLRYYPQIQQKMGVSLMKLLSTKKCVGANIKFDNLFCREKYGMSPPVGFDINLASHLLNENTPNGLKHNAIFELGADNWEININLKKGKILTRSDYEDYKTYLAYDILWTYKLYQHFREKLSEDPSLEKIYYNITLPAACAYEDIEEGGVYIDQEKFKELEKELYQKQNNILQELNKFGEINWSSDDQIRSILFDKLNYPVIEQTNSGKPSTSESVLLRLREHGPLPQLILDYRGVTIQITHFIEGWKERMVNGRLHPSFLINGTVTGRTSSKNPNLQQVPRDKAIRRLITAPPGYLFVESDYSQLELRVAALVSGEKAMTKAFQIGEDIHTKTGRIATGKAELTYEERKKAKALNFGFLYGMGWRKFKDYSRDSYGVIVDDEEAQLFRKRFFEAYSDLPRWHDRQRKIVRTTSQVRSPIGRIRHLPDINSRDKSKKAEAERQAINSPVQGFGSDMCILSMIEAHHTFDRELARCVGTVHDAILWEVREDYIIQFCEKLKQIMESPTALKEVFKFAPSVPIVTDVDIGAWGSGQSLKDYMEERGKLDEYNKLFKY